MPATTAATIRTKLLELAQDPPARNVKKLTGQPGYRLRGITASNPALQRQTLNWQGDLNAMRSDK